ncbi:hypothetical protein BGZ93_010394 [Podila epicladia]|nr:hypothetical protein BGZ92_008326 [Podila epicladia]KAG0098768.1 hypothetical protein BGZ93_010394 [Podila epicladia]
MKSSFIVTAIVAVSTSSVYAYQCPDTAAINQACRSVIVFPLRCNNPTLNKDECNAKQCNQAYIDNYAACQCRRNPEQFYEHAVNVEGIVRRCGVAGLINPYGNPLQYRPGQGTATFVPTPTRTSVGTATPTTAAPIVGPTESPVPVQSQSSGISGGAIAGIVLGCLAALAIAGLLAWCWRKKRHQHTAVYDQHTTYDSHGPTRTVVTEKIEPVVVKAGTTNFNTTTTSGTTPYSTATTSTPANTYSTGTNYDTHPSTSYNTTTSNTGYNTAYNAGRTAADGTQIAGQTASNNAYNAGSAASNAMH